MYWNLHQKGAVQYYQRKNGVEIDFVLNQRQAYEVKLHPVKEDMNKLQALGKDIGIEKTNIVGRDYVPIQEVLYLFNL